jgi:hypothetical protein
MDPPKRVKARIAATIMRQALRTGLAFKFSRDSRPVFKILFLILPFFVSSE